MIRLSSHTWPICHSHRIGLSLRRKTSWATGLKHTRVSWSSIYGCRPRLPRQNTTNQQGSGRFLLSAVMAHSVLCALAMSYGVPDIQERLEYHLSQDRRLSRGRFITEASTVMHLKVMSVAKRLSSWVLETVVMILPRTITKTVQMLPCCSGAGLMS